MKLSELAAKPQLINVVLDQPAIVERYGEPIEFYIYDRQNMETYMALSQVDGNNITAIAGVVVPLILNEDGTQMIEPDGVLPIDVLIAAVNGVVIRLGNPKSQTTPA